LHGDHTERYCRKCQSGVNIKVCIEKGLIQNNNGIVSSIIIVKNRKGQNHVMSRLKELRAYVDKKLNKIDDEDKRISATAHLYGVSLAAQILAKKRGLDSELAAMAGMLHDMHAYKTGSYDDHAHLGAELARKILGKLELTTPEETDIICSAIYHHDDKAAIDSPMDELLKDADVIDHCFKDASKPVKEKEQKRYDALCKELGLG
jgi:HD superfamily phosphodiesterase